VSGSICNFTSRDHLEAVPSAIEFRGFRRLGNLTRIDLVGEELPRFVASLPSHFQRYVGIHAKG
jgi:hypothetical protein